MTTRVEKLVWAWVVWLRKTIRVTMAPMAPTSMNGLRTLKRSDRTPKMIRATASAPQNHSFRWLAWATLKLRPSGFTNTVE